MIFFKYPQQTSMKLIYTPRHFTFISQPVT